MIVMRGSTPNSLLTFIKAKRGRAPLEEVREAAHALSSSDVAGNTALKRLIAAGCVVVECRITAKGTRAWQKARKR
jgi:hypothetical protein